MPGPSPGSLDIPRDRPFDLLAYGDPNVDYVVETIRAPAADEKVLGRRLGTFAGGTVANVACAAARLGARAAGYGRVGDDADGRMLLADNARFNVSNAYLSVSARQTSAAFVIIDRSGEKALVYAPMPADPLDEARLSRALARSALVYAMPYDLGEFATVARMAHDAGCLVAIDVEAAVAPDRERLEALLAGADIVFMNEGGFRAGSGGAPARPAITPLLDMGPRLIVVTLGARGAVAFTRDDHATQAAFPATMVDATGAGDCFNGAFLAALLGRGTLSASLAFACAAASFAVSRIGARTGLPTADEVARRLSGIP